MIQGTGTDRLYINTDFRLDAATQSATLARFDETGDRCAVHGRNWTNSYLHPGAMLKKLEFFWPAKLFPS